MTDVPPITEDNMNRLQDRLDDLQRRHDDTQRQLAAKQRIPCRQPAFICNRGTMAQPNTIDSNTMTDLTLEATLRHLGETCRRAATTLATAQTCQRQLAKTDAILQQREAALVALEADQQPRHAARQLGAAANDVPRTISPSDLDVDTDNALAMEDDDDEDNDDDDEDRDATGAML